MKTLTPRPGRLLAEPDVARAVGVRTLWFEPMTRALHFPKQSGTRGGVPAWDLEVVKRWLLRFELALRQPAITVEHLRWLVLRLVARRSATSIGAAVGSWARVEPITTVAAVHLVRRVPYQVQLDWAAARQVGTSDLQIAKRFRVGVSLVRLVLDGILKPLDGGRVNPYLLQHLWEQGLPVAVISRSLDCSPGRTRREIAESGDRLERRLNMKEVADWFGWTRTNVRGLRQPGHFPEPDSPVDAVSGNGKGAWWWAGTLERWATGMKLQTCPVCQGRFQRLNTHQRFAHKRAPRDCDGEPSVGPGRPGADR